MRRFPLFGAGRIGRIHAANIARMPRGAPLRDRRRPCSCSSARAELNGARRFDRATGSRRRHRRRADRELDRYARGADPALRARRQAVFCEKPLDLDAGARRAAWTSRRAGRCSLGFNRRYDPSFARLARDRRRRVGRSSRSHHQPRSRAAAARLCASLRRPVPRHDDPRLRHGAVAARRGAGASVRARQRAVDPAIGAAGDIDTAVVMLTTANGSCARSRTAGAAASATTSASRFSVRTAWCARTTTRRRASSSRARRVHDRAGAAVLPRALRGRLSPRARRVRARAARASPWTWRPATMACGHWCWRMPRSAR